MHQQSYNRGSFVGRGGGFNEERTVLPKNIVCSFVSFTDSTWECEAGVIQHGMGCDQTLSKKASPSSTVSDQNYQKIK